MLLIAGFTPDELTSHSTRLSKDNNQVAGYKLAKNASKVAGYARE
jgi:hypothetical protein